MCEKSSRDLLYYYKSSLKIGEIERYIISYSLYDEDEMPSNITLDPLWLRIKNVENITFRAAYLMGPYMIYCDVRNENYHHSQRLFVSADQPKFQPNILPQQEFIAELSLHNLKKRYVWVVDVVSQIIFTNTAQVGFEICVGSSRRSISRNWDLSAQSGSMDTKMTVTRQTTLDLWNLPLQVSLHANQKEHLVVLTHGLHSNVSADLFYMKEQIERSQKYYDNERIVVRGFDGNVCGTERGIKRLGTRLAEHIINHFYNDKTCKISFVGHSLGGTVQTFAIAYIAEKYPWFFEKVKPENFITLASPLLGIVTDNPAYINILLSFGIVGKTGQDLGLKDDAQNDKPLLYLLPGEPTKNVLRRFHRRTVYANATHDGIVPLYSAGLLFLDYEEILSQLQQLPASRKRLEAPSAGGGDFIKKNFLSPFTKAINLWAPQKFPDNQSDSTLPKVSIIESAASVLIPPLPDRSYIMDPASRENVILHDKIYSPDDIPLRESSSDKRLKDSKNLLLKAFTMTGSDESRNLESEIARRWHDGMSWRKVIVSLKPDAHNNLIVRRRFSNAYGWPIIDHLVQNHFNGIRDDAANGIENSSVDLPLTDDCKTNNSTCSHDNDWITRLEKDSLFDVGPTGMISTVGEILDSLGKNNPLLGVNSTPARNSDPTVLAQENLFKYEEPEGSMM
ncbi:LAMI_0E02806g1_1 [Lachancea mirantina]|uniref:LAMI_0E02806g1_1 n=1 Tax=Lachancea mirantina TaxID=1230905 RepID=A0A1G4JJC2_9SACH|nr:LAMI_0E02806g1_1 [Lachancea mirantina]